MWPEKQLRALAELSLSLEEIIALLLWLTLIWTWLSRVASLQQLALVVRGVQPCAECSYKTKSSIRWQQEWQLLIRQLKLVILWTPLPQLDRCTLKHRSQPSLKEFNKQRNKVAKLFSAETCSICLAIMFSRPSQKSALKQKSFITSYLCLSCT